MRTKTLLLAAVALAVGMISAQAQTVYSANVVGYVNLTITNNGYTLAANPMDFDGSGTNNTVLNLIGTNLPINSQIQTWNGSGFAANSYTKPKSGNPVWGAPGQKLNAGQGFFVYNPSNVVVTVTLVGTVDQGNLTNNYLLAGAPGAGAYSLISGTYATDGLLTSTFGYAPSINDQIQTWNGSGFAANSYTKPKSGNPVWGGGEPVLKAGVGYFLLTTNHSPTMITNFTVQ
jgi:hypothetical protein